jgi:hypothetical protein
VVWQNIKLKVTGPKETCTIQKARKNEKKGIEAQQGKIIVKNNKPKNKTNN